MRYSTTLASVALVAGAAAKPQARREKSCPAPSAPVHVPGEGSVVPVPVPVESSSSVGAESVSSAAPYPVPTGYANSTVPGPSFSSFISIVIPTSASAIETSSLASSAIAASSAISEPVLTSSAPASESSAPGSTVPVGQVIFECTEPDTFALTYDDGPFTYTNGILDLLAETDIKATFFVNGNNFGNINNFQDVIRRMVADGHQIGSHTYAHPDLATLGDAGVIDAMVELEDALDAIIGEIPTYMRPPFFSYNDQTLRVLGELGYHVIQADIDTFDYQSTTIGDLTGATNLQNGINAGGNLALAHDVHQNTGEVLTPEFIRIIQASGLRGVTVGECLGDPASNWYRARRSSTPTATSGPSSTVSITSTSTPTGAVDPNGSCGGSTGFVCGPGACCSEHGFCGTSIAYCGAGCQPDFGVCGVNVPANPGGEDGGSPAPAPGGVSPDNTCGGDNAYTCPGSTCCSQYGFCGDTTDHCGAGCQNAFGVCT